MLPIQYADFAVWQRQWLQGEVLTQQLAYWKAQLAGAPTVLDVPTDHPRPAVQSLRGAQEKCLFPKELRATLHAMSRAEGGTLFMTLVAAWKALLYRYTGQTHVVIGTPITHRRRVELEGLLGFFVNTLVLHTHLTGRMSFRELLARVRQVTLEAFDHSDLPFEKLVEELQPARTLHYHPLFQVMFNFRSAPEEGPNFPNLTVECLSLESTAEQFDLTLSITDSADGLQGILTYNADLFEAPSVSRMLGHYRTLLDAVSASPDLSIASLPLLPPSEQHGLLVTWNETQREYPRDRCLHQLFETQAARRPEAVAVVCNGHCLTYRQLNQQANQLAHFLRTLGVGPEVYVGICVERSLAMLVGLLGILKAGGVYVPLDPTYPPERLAFILADTQTPFVLAQTHLVDRLPPTSAKVICVDGDWDSITQQSNTNPANLTTADNLAYVTYTSGSTGQPKGVCIPHRGVVRLVMHTNYVTLTASNIILQFAPLAFDASTFEIWGSLLHGARLVVAPPRALSVEELGQLLQDSQVTVLWLTANLFQHMVDRQRASLRQLRQLLAGGDMLSAPHVRQALQEMTAGTLINGYGPTENTTFTCCYPVTESSQAGQSVPIGRPVANTQVYVLDDALQPVPVGVPGELYTGGDGLARGYFNRPELTAERFIPHPFSATPGTRLYKTGDLVRYRADGTLEFLGRLDHQVKVRGFRIEPGEIEAVLGQHPQVREAVIVAQEETPGEKRLVAYVVMHQSCEQTPGELRRFLQGKLPAYMVPSAFMVLEALPLTTNGKIDRLALPIPARHQARDSVFIAPRMPLEEQLATLWATLLNVSPISVHDDFFALGGHSLLATQMVSRLRDAFQVELPLRCLFEAPTVAGLAEVIETMLWARQEPQPACETPLSDREEGEL